MGLRYAFDTQACEFSTWFIFERYTDLIVGVPPGGGATAGAFFFLFQVTKDIYSAGALQLITRRAVW